MSISYGLGLHPPGNVGGGGAVTVTYSDVAVTLDDAEITVELDTAAEVAVEFVTPEIGLCEE